MTDISSPIINKSLDIQIERVDLSGANKTSQVSLDNGFWQPPPGVPQQNGRSHRAANVVSKVLRETQSLEDSQMACSSHTDQPPAELPDITQSIIRTGLQTRKAIENGDEDADLLSISDDGNSDDEESSEEVGLEPPAELQAPPKRSLQPVPCVVGQAVQSVPVKLVARQPVLPAPRREIFRQKSDHLTAIIAAAALLSLGIFFGAPYAGQVRALIVKG